MKGSYLTETDKQISKRYVFSAFTLFRMMLYLFGLTVLGVNLGEPPLVLGAIFLAGLLGVWIWVKKSSQR